MNELVEFLYSEKQQIRVVIKDGEPWFVAKDVCDALEISNNRDAVGRLDEDEKGVVLTDTPGGTQKSQAVSEPGLYKLIMSSRKAEAKSFQRWIAHEVLPTIRKTGSYSLQAPKPTHRIPADYIEALEYAVSLAKANVQLQERVDELEPKAGKFDLLMAGNNAVTINEFVKAFGCGWGRNKLFAWMREQKLLMHSNLPYQRYVDAGYFAVREVPKPHGFDNIVIHSQTLITPKGMSWLSEKLLQQEAVIQLPEYILQ